MMKVNKDELLKVLNQVKPGLAKKEIIEQATHFIFASNEVAAFNDYICITHPFPTDLEFSVKGDDLFKIISGISENEIDLSLENTTLKIKSKKTKAALSIIIEETAKVTHLIEYIKTETEKKNFWKTLPTEFTQGLHLCSFSASTDMSTGIKSCCAVHGDAIYSTDNIRGSVYIMDAEMDDLLLPAKAVSDLIKYNITQYGISENWAHFKTPDNVVFSCKIMKGDYPFKAIDKLFPDISPLLTFPTDLIEAVKGMSILAEGESEADKTITMEIGKSKIICKAEKERGWINKEVDIEYDGEPFTMMINPTFLCQVLQKATSFAIESNRGIFTSDNFSHILSLPTGD